MTPNLIGVTEIDCEVLQQLREASSHPACWENNSVATGVNQGTIEKKNVYPKSELTRMLIQIFMTFFLETQKSEDYPSCNILYNWSDIKEVHMTCKLCFKTSEAIALCEEQ